MIDDGSRLTLAEGLGLEARTSAAYAETLAAGYLDSRLAGASERARTQ